MALSKLVLDRLRKRDPYCIHCGETNDLVPHHRKNRGMGGSKQLDRLDNILMICAEYNGLMESDLTTANRARDYGHKLQSWQEFTESVFDTINGAWYRLDDKGLKEEVNPPSKLF